MKAAIYPGSFDPITIGHVDIIRRLAPLFESLTVVVANSRSKTYLFSIEKRVELIRESVADLPSVSVKASTGLVVDTARELSANVIVRGLRAVSDFEAESAMANMNRQLAPDLETMIVFTRPEYSFVASRMVKEVASHGGDLSGLVSPHVEKELLAQFQKR